MVSRLKKKLTQEVEDFCFETVSESGPNTSASTELVSEVGLDRGSQVDGGFLGEF